MATLEEQFKQGVTKVCSPNWDDKEAYMKIRKNESGEIWGEVFTKDGVLMIGKEVRRVPWDKIAKDTFWIPFKE